MGALSCEDRVIILRLQGPSSFPARLRFLNVLYAPVFILRYSVLVVISILQPLFDVLQYLITNLTFVCSALSFFYKTQPCTFSIRASLSASMHLKYSFTLSSSLWLLSNAAAMPTASNVPGNFSKALLSNAAAIPPASNQPGNFTNVLCGDGDIGNPAASAALRWSEADASDAWEAVARYWNENPASNGLTFVQAVSHYWNGPEGWNCGAVGSDPCDSAPQSCGDKSKASKDIDTPAGWLILQSFSTIHNVSLPYHWQKP